MCRQTNPGLAKPLESEPATSQDKTVSPALTDAIIKGDLKLCQHLIGRGFSIDGTCECGCIVIVKACVHNQVDVATYLFQLGASVHGVACSKEFTTAGFSALHLAAFNGQLELFESILKQRPAISEEGIQPIHLAARSGRLTILRFILEHTEDKRKLLEARNSKTRVSPSGGRLKFGEELGYACPLHFAVKFQHVEATEILLRAGAALEAREEQGLTALQLAAQGHSHKEMFELLIGVGANTNTRDHEGITPLMRAATHSHHVKVIKGLVGTTTNGLDLQAVDIFGRTALHHAVEKGQLAIAKCLVTAGLDPTKTDHFGNSSIQIALQKEMDPFPLENLPTVDTLRSTTRGSILNTAAFMGHEEVVTELLRRAPEMDVQEYVNLACDTGTPLYSATSRGNISIMEKLFEKGAKINLTGGLSGSPLMIACKLGHIETVAWLLRRGAELQSTKVDGTTIMAEEAAQQHKSVLFLLQRFKERGVEALDEEIPIQTANISRLDEFMVGYNQHKVKRSGHSSDGRYYSGAESDDESELDEDLDDEKDGKNDDV
jgi:ankyrin repeat protein